MAVVGFRRSMTKISYPWYGGALFGFALLFAQSFVGRFDTNFVEAWNWFAPHVVPTIGIITSALIAASQRKSDERTVDTAIYRLALLASWTYVVFLNLTILAIPFALVNLEMYPLEWLQGANAIIGVFQGIALGFIGFFYGKADA